MEENNKQYEEIIEQTHQPKDSCKKRALAVETLQTLMIAKGLGPERARNCITFWKNVHWAQDIESTEYHLQIQS